MRFVSHHNFLIKIIAKAKENSVTGVTPFEGRKCQIIPIRSRLRVAVRQLNEAICLYADIEIAVTISSWKTDLSYNVYKEGERPRLTFPTNGMRACSHIIHFYATPTRTVRFFIDRSLEKYDPVIRSPGLQYIFNITFEDIHFPVHKPRSRCRATLIDSTKARTCFYVCSTIVSKITEARYKKRMNSVKTAIVKSYRNYWTVTWLTVFYFQVLLINQVNTLAAEFIYINPYFSLSSRN